MKKLVFATNNLYKLDEVKKIIGDAFHIISLKECDILEDIPETGVTLKENSQQKADYVFNKSSLQCFADDTGLEIEALNGDPGVYSARYAGENCSYEDNMYKVLDKMTGKTNRKACFKTVICLIFNGKKEFFEGRVDGQIIEDPRGAKGFGYDPIFIPDGYDKTFAQMDDKLKNSISHRYRASIKLKNFLDIQ